MNIEFCYLESCRKDEQYILIGKCNKPGYTGISDVFQQINLKITLIVGGGFFFVFFF
jgi:hypothetical protein